MVDNIVALSGNDSLDTIEVDKSDATNSPANIDINFVLFT
jgi:hypothetical protein